MKVFSEAKVKLQSGMTAPRGEIRAMSSRVWGIALLIGLAVLGCKLDKSGGAPRAENDDVITAKETPVTIAVLANDTDPDGGTLTVTAVSKPVRGQAVINPDQTVTYTPEANFVGLDSFTYDVSNGETKGGAEVTIFVGSIIRVSVASDGTEGAGSSYMVSFSANGRYMVFDSDAPNLVPKDTNDTNDVFMHNLQTTKTTRISVASDGTQGNEASYSPSISADGRYVVFTSDASNLVSGDTNGKADIFMYELETGKTTRVSVASDGTQGNEASYSPSISADGSYVVFYSFASNLAPGDTNGKADIFLYERETGKTTRVSVASDGTQSNEGSYAPSISADGRYVVFYSFASNLVPNDKNRASDIFVHERETGKTTRVSVASDGTESNYGSHSPSISVDGRYVAFDSYASNLVPGDTNLTDDIFVYDRQTGKTTRVSVASDGTQSTDGSYWPLISADGRYVTFYSSASNLVPGNSNGTSNILVHDQQTGKTTRFNVAEDGTQSTDGSYWPSFNATGRYVAFTSEASNLVQGDTNHAWDIFVTVNK